MAGLGERGAAVTKVGGAAAEAPDRRGDRVGASGQTQSLASSCLSSPKLAALCWQPLNPFTGQAVSAQSRASGATDGGVCRVYIVTCGVRSHSPNAGTPGLSWVFRSSALLTFRFGIRL